MRLSRYCGESKQAGFTLIEVLIALLVLLVGLLGVAGVQIVSFQNNQAAYFRSQATLIGSEFLDQIRTNRADRVVNGGTIVTSYNNIDTRTASGTMPDCAASSCTGEQLADMHILNLAALFQSTPPALPGGYATVNVNTVTAGGDTLFEYVVEVFWSEKERSGNGGNVRQAAASRRSVQLRTVIR